MGLSLGQTGFVPGTTPEFVPGTNRGSSQSQPDQKVYVYVPFSCLSCGTSFLDAAFCLRLDGKLTFFFPVRVLGRVVFSTCGCHTPAQHWLKESCIHGSKNFIQCWGLGLDSGGKLLRHTLDTFQSSTGSSLPTV